MYLIGETFLNKKQDDVQCPKINNCTETVTLVNYIGLGEGPERAIYVSHVEF
jgi:hypothetical protein